ncbi:MAG: helix-turn-helix domain-containing protein [Lachnospiraceae bacterium]|nr:helix-turn-helix domain-containing protein [Lachnospiraceae bacterium]
MSHDVREHLSIHDEKGIVERGESSFHSPLDFAADNLFYVVWSNRYKCSSQYAVKRDCLDYYSVIFVIGGQMEVFYEGERIVVRENEAVLLDFRRPHEYRTLGDQLEKWEMVFKGNASDAYYKLITEQWGHRFEVRGRMKEILRSLMKELAAPFPSDHVISSKIHEMFSSMIEQKAVRLSPAIQEAISYMYAHYGSPLQINEIADHAALSRPYFSRRFTKETGRSPYDYLAQIRINAAKEMLAEQDLPIAEIAERCGFTGPSHFSSFFREKTGQTPAGFRKVFRLTDAGSK